MINKLKKVFSTLVIHEQDNEPLDESFSWFLTSKKEVIGINKSEMTKKDITLLSTFLDPYNVKLPVQTANEVKWGKLIKREKNFDNTSILPYRFIYFCIQKKGQIEPIELKDAIYELYNQQVPILWMNEQEGIIIEEQLDNTNSISFESFIDVFMSDLYTKINLFVGPYQDSVKEVFHYYNFILKTAATVFENTNKPVITYKDAIPLLLIAKTDEQVRGDITRYILGEFKNDKNTLKMIHTFVKCNLNISEAAKNLYMHRNSLQYRLDKFNEKTGLDIRRFDHAMAVYLAILGMNTQ